MEDIVQRLESGKVKLDDAIESYARGALLKAHCQAKLKEAQARIDNIDLDGGHRPAPGKRQGEAGRRHRILCPRGVAEGALPGQAEGGSGPHRQDRARWRTSSSAWKAAR